jgi:hypothetical protein
MQEVINKNNKKLHKLKSAAGAIITCLESDNSPKNCLHTKLPRYVGDVELEFNERQNFN